MTYNYRGQALVFTPMSAHRIREEIAAMSNFHYWITDNAVDKYREYAPPEDRGLLDVRLAQLLDTRIHDGVIAGRSSSVIDTDHTGSNTTIVEFISRPNVKSVAVMRPYKPGDYPRPRVVGAPSGAGLLVITVMSTEAAASALSTGRWRPVGTVRPSYAAPLTQPLLRPGVVRLEESPVQPAAPATAPDSAPAPAPSPASDTRFSRGASMAVRLEFVKQVLRERPNIRHGGPDGLSALVKAKFGAGIAAYIVKDVRDLMAKETPSSPAPASGTVADRLARAAEEETKAKEALDAAAKALAKATEDHATATRELVKCRTLVESLVKELRGG